MCIETNPIPTVGQCARIQGLEREWLNSDCGHCVMRAEEADQHTPGEDPEVAFRWQE